TGRSGRGPPSRANSDRAAALLRQLVADFPKVPDYRWDLCECLGRPRSGDDDRRWRELLREAIALSAPLVAEFPNVPDYAAARARYFNQSGVAEFLAGKPDEALELLQTAVTTLAKLV